MQVSQGNEKSFGKVHFGFMNLIFISYSLMIPNFF